ncbi:MAG: S8 family peptidase [Crocinitomicaceae bacterium]|nr:S8 family peptidase [Crocinitomicaceae bacterium]
MNKIVIKLSLAVFALGISSLSYGQEDVDKKILNWYNGGGSGMNTEAAYKKLKKRESETVIVAIIDSGMDIEHVDLQGKIWTNTDEIAGNGVDDDNNGYIDDVHGWNFLGNANGDNANDIRLEMTRIYAELKPKYDGQDVTITTDEEREEYLLFLEVQEKVEEELANAQGTLSFYQNMLPNMVDMAVTEVKKQFGEEVTAEQVENWKVVAGSPEERTQNLALLSLTGELEGMMTRVAEHFETSINVHYNIDHDGRAVVGDDPSDFSDVNYGNNDVEGPDAFHGTHVGGIVGAVRGNGIGGDGVANDVLLMSIRAVPNGDEFDKDIALAIRYAVDNGASVINMSFGKAYSPNAEEVFAAFQYADEHGVLLVHAAGNDAKDIDEEPNYPTSMYDFQQKKLDHFLTIGASSRYLKDRELAASFSNYGSVGVDVFAPGLEIYNSVPQSEYAAIQGTSMASPMVAGAAAMLKSYFPKMSMKEIKDVLLASATSYQGEAHVKPGGKSQDEDVTSDMVDFSTLSVTGGVINLLEAVNMCLELEEAK